jgi:hypothetical protein
MQPFTFVRSLSLSVAVLLGACAVSAPAAVILTTDDGFGADTYLTNDSNSGATVVHGGEGAAEIRRFDGTRARLSYLKFDLSGVAGSLDGATLSYTYDSIRGRTISVYGLTDNATDDSWGESVTSYSNAPGIVQPDAGGAAHGSAMFTLDTGKLTLLGTLAFNDTRPGSTSVYESGSSTTAALNLDAFLANDTNDLVTLVFVNGNDSAQDAWFATKENTSGRAFPTLTLPNALVPEPSGVALVGAGGLALLARRRRHRRGA